MASSNANCSARGFTLHTRVAAVRNMGTRLPGLLARLGQRKIVGGPQHELVFLAVGLPDEQPVTRLRAQPEEEVGAVAVHLLLLAFGETQPPDGEGFRTFSGMLGTLVEPRGRGRFRSRGPAGDPGAGDLVR